MASIELLRPELHGARFNTGSISLEFLSDLSALGQLIKDVAKWHFLEENPGRQRLPRGFNDRADLKLTKIDVGSTIPVIELATSDHPTHDESLMYDKLFKAAVKDIVSTIDAAGQNVRASPNGHIPPHYLAHFNGIGRNLRDDESIVLRIPSSSISARLDQTKRRELLELSRVRVRTEETTLRGSIPEADQDRMSFELQLSDGTKIQAPLPEQHHDAIMDATRQYRTGARVLIQGIGMYDQRNRLTSLQTVNDVNLLDPLDVADRLDGFRALQDGWLEDGASAPSHDGLDWLSTVFDRYFPSDGILPHTFPTYDGGVRMEWSHENHKFILEIDLEGRLGEWLWFDRTSDQEDERQLNMDERTSWKWVASEIIYKVETNG